MSGVGKWPPVMLNISGRCINCDWQVPQHIQGLATHPGCVMTSSYRLFCRRDNRHFKMCSYFLGSCFSTSLLERRRMNGWIICTGDDVGELQQRGCLWIHVYRKLWHEQLGPDPKHTASYSVNSYSIVSFNKLQHHNS